MAVLSRFARATRSWRAIPSSSLRTLNPSRDTSCDLPPPTLLFLRSFNHQIHSSSSKILRPRWASNANELPNSLFPALLASFIAVGMLQVAHADSDENASKPPSPSESSPSSYGDLEEIAKKERQRIEELLKSKGIKYGSYPRFTIAVKGQKVTIKFQIPPACDTPQLIANLVSNLGVKVDERGAGSDMLLRAWDSAVAWQLTLNYPEKQKEISGERGHSGDMKVPEGDLCILLFRSLISSDKPEVEFIKSGSLSTTELDAFVSVLQLAGSKLRPLDRKPVEGSARVPSADKSVASLESMGVRIYGIDEPLVNSSSNDISWENIAGYDQQKREIEDTILLALQSPEVYDDIARGTRRKFESNRPRAVLFEGPPGTGKTSCARVIATQAGVPLLYVPLEVVMSKYYGESERLLGKVFTLANEIPNGAIIFLDEVDSFAAARDSEMHEATRRILSVLLRQIDGFEQDKKVVVIAATNRKQDLDPALISRFDSMITFGLPDRQNRQEIAAQYAKHLTESELEEFARVTEDMSGRDIRDVCQQAERSWASKIIRGQASKDGEQGNLPPLAEYTESAMNRRKALASIAEQKSQGSIMRPQKPQLDTC
ncbi:PREDICTED: 26S protease regulatory subunit 7 homolog isoform X1 [Populus euphratica]|uniref:26S protease regulatory subunit 7 homolog isoform X1 n=1 Tax=Populus euphratica TaxID=75702 RepID=A0AAJ6VGA4_POPEU|nr:PREDICTED: 26S protease regulatory subunit 7 homolog isoform X1 [Populus euphratica]